MYELLLFEELSANIPGAMAMYVLLRLFFCLNFGLGLFFGENNVLQFRAAPSPIKHWLVDWAELFLKNTNFEMTKSQSDCNSWPPVL